MRRAVLLPMLLALAGCGLGPAAVVGNPLSEQAQWCRANSSVAVLEAAVTLGYPREEIRLLLDDITVTGWPAAEQDARYVRACDLAYGNR